MIKILKGKKHLLQIFVIFRANKLAQNAKHTLGSSSLVTPLTPCWSRSNVKIFPDFPAEPSTYCFTTQHLILCIWSSNLGQCTDAGCTLVRFRDVGWLENNIKISTPALLTGSWCKNNPCWATLLKVRVSSFKSRLFSLFMSREVSLLCNSPCK